jgi:hypothetical protein
MVDFIQAIQAAVYPFSKSSAEFVRAALVGGETQLGRLRWSAYPKGTLAWVVQSAGSLLGVFTIGESDLLDIVWGMMFFLPGMWWTVNMYLMDFSW